MPSTRTGLEVDGTPSVPWSRAKQIYDEMTAATEANDRMNPERLEKQLAAEHAGCMQGVNAYEAAKARGEGACRAACT